MVDVITNISKYVVFCSHYTNDTVQSVSGKMSFIIGALGAESECSHSLAFTCSIYGGTGSLQGTKALSSKGYVLLVEG